MRFKLVRIARDWTRMDDGPVSEPTATENAMMIAVVARARGARVCVREVKKERPRPGPSCCDELRRHDLQTYHGRIDTARWHVLGLFRQYHGSMQNTIRERARTARCMNTVMQLATKAASGGKRSIGTRSLFSQCSLVFSLHACLVCLSLIGISAVLNYEGCTRQRRSPIPVSYTHLTLPTICSV